VVETGLSGVWSSALRDVDPREASEAAAELEELGFTAIWIPGRGPDDLEDRLRLLLAATRAITVATGIVSIWSHPARSTAALHARIAAAFRHRFLLGIGVSHAPAAAQAGAEYRRPLSAMIDYLDELDAAPEPVPREERVLAALAPRMLELARDRARGSHTYLVTPEHTRLAREALGPDALLAPEQTVVLERDPDRARAVAREWLARYLRLPNYVDNLVRTGFDRAEVEGAGDRVVDEVVAWGDVEAVVARVEAHRAAGADHVALQVVTPDPTRLPREQWRRLAAALRPSSSNKDSR
jgi:probable F420-dependent oxidoreductase